MMEIPTLIRYRKYKTNKNFPSFLYFLSRAYLGDEFTSQSIIHLEIRKTVPHVKQVLRPRLLINDFFHYFFQEKKNREKRQIAQPKSTYFGMYF